MDKNLVVSLDEIKGIRLQCKKCRSEVIFSPTTPYLHASTCPQGDPWEEKRLSPNNLYMFLVLLCYMRFKDRLSFGWRLQ